MGSIRIISGEKRGHKIRVPPGRTVRPMTERAREAIFNQLGAAVSSRPVWDLFAGSGALGLEALSRGAPWAVFVELDRRVADQLTRNIQKLGYEQRSRVVRADVFRWIHSAVPFREPGLVFVAPPYELYTKRLPDLVYLWRRLVAMVPDETAVVVQLDRDTDPGLLPKDQQWDVRIYGEVRNALCWVHHEALSSPHEAENLEKPVS
jgi:16S rRNA (guanine966-N2)-methyltransferase